ncbi:MAG: gamma-glutamyltranspeptidase [bacterium]|nr:gamma-glutamyltranspeptidase [bacterium]
MTLDIPARIDGASLTAKGRAAVVTPHALASQAAIDILKKGGNAADAAIAANATLGVVAPETCGIGGDLFALIHSPNHTTPDTLNSSGRAGSGATATMLRDSGLTSIPIDSPSAITVPGCVDGWEALADRHGSLPLGTILESAIAHATEGFAVTPELAGSLHRFQDVLAPQTASRGLYPGGATPDTGDMVTRPDLAATLAAIGQSGRSAFYAGQVAEEIVSATRGVLRAEDLAKIQARWIKPISLDIMGWRGWTIPPNSQGYLTLAAAWLFEKLDPPHDPQDPAFTHAAIEAFRAVAWERDDYVADPRFAPLSAAELVSTERLARRLDRISMDHRTEWPTATKAPGGTAYLCVSDAQGMGVSLIQSNFHGIGSKIGVGNSGFFLHDRGSGFTLEPGHPNELAPGKQPLHTLSPTLWTSDSALTMLLGTRGGHFQPQTLLQMLAYMRWADCDPAAAQLLPRWTTSEWRDSGTTVTYEPHLDRSVVADLGVRGHTMEAAPGWMAGWGPVSVINVAGEVAIGAADPRGAATASESI